MTWVDLVVLAVLALSAVLAFMRGLVREVLGVGAWVGALAAGAWGAPKARPEFDHWFGASPWAYPINFVVIFLIVLLILMLIARGIGRVVYDSPLGGLDRTLGLVFGLLRGAALVVLAYIIAGLVIPVERWPEPVKAARFLSVTYEGARWAIDQLPEKFRPGKLDAPPPGRNATAEALLRAIPQGSALGRTNNGHEPGRE